MKLPTMILAVALVTIIGPAAATQYSPCQLATLVTNNGMPGNNADWVCLITNESGGNTAARGPVNTDGSYDFGLLQINSRYWCGLDGPGGDCNIACSSLLDDNVADDFECAKKIYGIHEFRAWTAWVNKCQDHPPQVNPC